MTRFVDLCDTFRLPGRELRRQPGLPGRHRGGEAGHDPQGRARAQRGLPGDDAVVLDHRAQGVRRGGRGPLEPHAVQACATPGRAASGARSRSRAASRPPTSASSQAADDPEASCATSSRTSSPRCAIRSSRPRRSGSRRSSTRARRARCSSNSRAAPTRSSRWIAARSSAACGLSCTDVARAGAARSSGAAVAPWLARCSAKVRWTVGSERGVSLRFLLRFTSAPAAPHRPSRPLRAHLQAVRFGLERRGRALEARPRRRSLCVAGAARGCASDTSKLNESLERLTGVGGGGGQRRGKAQLGRSPALTR